ncbi:MAG: hypothetical protein HQL21_08490 [Candidatus Omnitrophica bacterium]|nr:hypothetical protein [Candidatus Omnitrophota bacterium]
MGFFDVFKKESHCASCHVVKPKDQLNDIDFSRRWAEPGGEKALLCRECMMARVTRGIKSFSGQAVVVWPMKKYGGYHYYSFSEMPGLEYEHDVVQKLRTLLEPKGRSCQCQKVAVFTWCSPEIFSNDPMGGEAHLSSAGAQYVCADCLCQALEEKIKEQDISFREINVPVGENGLWTPMEC